MKRLVALCVGVTLMLLAASGAAATKPTPGGGDYRVTGFDPEGCILLGVSGTLDGELTLCQVGQNGTDRATFVGEVHLDGGIYSGTAVVGFSQTDRFTVLSGTGELRGFHGQGVAVDDETGLAGTYAGRFHFDP